MPLNFHGKDMELNIHYASRLGHPVVLSLDELVHTIRDEPMQIYLEPGDGTRYYFILAYHPAFGLIVTIPNHTSQCATFNLDFYRDDTQVGFDTVYGYNFFYRDEGSYLYSKNEWTIEVRKWFIKEVIDAFMKEL